MYSHVLPSSHAHCFKRLGETLHESITTILKNSLQARNELFVVYIKTNPFVGTTEMEKTLEKRQVFQRPSKN